MKKYTPSVEQIKRWIEPTKYNKAAAKEIVRYHDGNTFDWLMSLKNKWEGDKDAMESWRYQWLATNTAGEIQDLLNRAEVAQFDSNLFSFASPGYRKRIATGPGSATAIKANRLAQAKQVQTPGIIKKDSGRTIQITKAPPQSVRGRREMSLTRKPVQQTPTKTVDPEQAKIRISPAWKVLEPLAGTMKNVLSMKGYTPAGRIDLLAQQFYNEVVRKNQSNNFSGETELPPIYVYEFDTDNADIAAEQVTKAIVSYFNNLQAKADAGGELSQTENILLQSMNESPEKIKFGVMEIATIAGAVGLLLVAIFMK